MSLVSEAMPSTSTPTRVSIVGAGSAVFSLQLVRDLCSTHSLAGSEVVFMDVDTDRLQAVTTLARRLAAELDSDIHFEETLDQEAALREAEFVVNVAYASGHSQGMKLGDVTARHGYYHSSAGVYGHIDHWSFADLRMRLDFARDMEKFCPDAWLLQSGNPVFEGCTLMARETGIKLVGLCDGVKQISDICRVLSIDPAEVAWEAPGLNHQIWLTRFLYKGEDAYPLLDRWIEEESEQFWQGYLQNRPHDVQMARGAINLYQLFGLMPVGDAVRDPINWWLHTDREAKRHWFGEPWGGPDTPDGRREFIRRLDEAVDRIASISVDPRQRVTDVLDGVPAYEMHIPIIDALLGNRTGVFQVNVRNDRTLAGVPDDVVVEVPARVDRSGIHPLPVTPLPPKLMLQQILPRVLQMEQTLEAFRTGDRSMLLWGVLMHPQTRSYEQAVRVLEDILGMEGDEGMAAHHTWPPTTPRHLHQGGSDGTRKG